MNPIDREISRRRSFAIISHPDAGKTTLTEKLLLYGGAIQLAGSVTARRNQRSATSDWMELEKQRGISITSTVLQFEFEGYVLNLLDTPGHEDFSADTYRTLTAADSAIMLIDNAKGVEAQTRKLFAVCSQKGTPVCTFVNKMDHPGKGPLALLTEVEDVLGIRTAPVNWPIGHGDLFKGVYDRATRRVHLYEKVAHGSTVAGEKVLSLDDPTLKSVIGEELYNILIEEIELLDVAGDSFDQERFAKGELTPVFFGSALSNFGVELFLRQFVQIAPLPAARPSEGVMVRPDEPFSGFVFKIQANMDAQHRDRIAFMRIVSGKFEKDMEVTHTRTGKKMRLTRPQRLFAAERETVLEAYSGDVVGLTNPGAFRLGDTLSVRSNIKFDEVPPFVPESWALLLNEDVSKLKAFEKGVTQLTEEGLVDLFSDTRAHRLEPILGAVGKLQFEVVQHRLMSEYGVKTRLEPLSFTVMRWAIGSEGISLAALGANVKRLRDSQGYDVVLANSEWNLDFLLRHHPALRLFNSLAELKDALEAATPSRS